MEFRDSPRAHAGMPLVKINSGGLLHDQLDCLSESELAILQCFLANFLYGERNRLQVAV
jgi:hypothetical protein